MRGECRCRGEASLAREHEQNGLAMRQEDHDHHRANAAPETDATGASVVVCPFCGSKDVELISLFGGQLSTDQYYCRACRTYFERFARDDQGQ